MPIGRVRVERQGRGRGGKASLRAGFLALWALSACGVGASGQVGRACMGSGRDAANAALCSCVGRVASQSLSAADQRRAASFFGDPERAQEVRSSDSGRDDAFWARYRAFADRAEAVCG